MTINFSSYQQPPKPTGLFRALGRLLDRIGKRIEAAIRGRFWPWI